MAVLAGAAGGLAAGLASSLGRELVNAATAFYTISKNASQFGDALDKATQKTGLTAKNLSILKAQAEADSASFDDVLTSIKFLNKGIAELEVNAKTGGKGLQALGFSAEDFKKVGNDLNKLLPEILKRFAEMPAGPEKTKVALDLFGKSGTNLIPTLNELGRNMDATVKKFEHFGVIVGDDFVQRAKNFDDSMDNVRMAQEGLKNVIGNELMPVLTDVNNAWAEWIASNKELIQIRTREFAADLSVTVNNLAEFLHGLMGDTDNVTDSFGWLSEATIALNTTLAALLAGIIKITQGISLYYKGLRLLAEAGVALGLSTPKDLAYTNKLVEDLDKRIEMMKGSFNKITAATQRFSDRIHSTTPEIDEMAYSTDDARRVMDKLKASQDKADASTKKYTADMGSFAGKTKESKSEADKLAEAMKKYGEQTLESLQGTAMALRSETEQLNVTGEALTQLKVKQIMSNIEWDKLPAEIGPKVVAALQDIGNAMNELDFKKSQNEMAEWLKSFDEALAGAFKNWQDKELKKQFDGIKEYAANIASTISKTIADMLTAAFTGSFDDIKRSWKDMFKNLLNIFLQFVTSIIANPIRIALEGALVGGGQGETPQGGEQGTTPQGGGGGGGLWGALKTGLGGIMSFFGKGFTAFKGLFTGASFAGGFTAIVGSITSALGFVGAIAGAVMMIMNLVMGFLKKTPRLDIDFDSIKDEFGKRAASVGEILDPEFFKDAIAKISVKRGGVGLGLGGDTGIKDAIYKVIKGTIESIQAVIYKLPSDLAATLNKALLSAQIDTTTVIAGERFLEFDALGKKIAEKFKAFIEGELSAKFIMSIHDFFQGAYTALGVLPDKAKEIIDKQMEAYAGAGSREARGEVGKAALEQFNAFVDAFNLSVGRFGDSAEEAIDAIKALSTDLGFEGIPTFKEMSEALKTMIANADIDPAVIEKYKTLRAAIAEAGMSLTSLSLSLIDFINDLNTKIVQLGGTALDTAGALDQTISSLMNLINSGMLGASQMQQALQQLVSAADREYAKALADAQAEADRLNAEADAAAQAENDRLQRAAQAEADRINAMAEAQKNALNKQIEGMQKQLQLITEKTNIEIDGYEAALDAAKAFKQMAESLKNDLRNLFTGSSSVLTSIEKLNYLMADINKAQRDFASAKTPEARIAGMETLRDLQNQLIDLGSEAFGTSSPEFQALFRKTADELQKMVDIADKEGLKADTLQSKIDSLTKTLQTQTDKMNASIQASQAALANINTQQVQASYKQIEATHVVAQISQAAADRLREIYEFARTKAAELLQKTIDALNALGVDTSVLEPTLAIQAEQLTVLRSIDQTISNLAGLQHGTKGFQDFGKGKLRVLHGVEAVIRPEDLEGLRGGGNNIAVTFKSEFQGGVSESTLSFFAKEQVKAVEDWMLYGSGRNVIQKVVSKR